MSKGMEDLLGFFDATEDEDVSKGRPDSPETVVFHVVVDGFTAFDEVWTRGTEFTIQKDSPQYLATLDRDGESWLNHISDVDWQIAHWGEQRVSEGSFRPKRGERTAYVDVAPVDYNRRGGFPFPAIR